MCVLVFNLHALAALMVQKAPGQPSRSDTRQGGVAERWTLHVLKMCRHVRKGTCASCGGLRESGHAAHPL
jgi:hypothetical protein